MKKLCLSVLFLMTLTLGFAQSKSYQVLHDNFRDQENVHSFHLSGFLCRTAASMLADEDDESLLEDLMEDIDHIRFIIIPAEEFARQGLSVKGFRSYLVNDSFEEVLSVHDHDDHIMVFHRVEGNKKNRYFVLVEDETEVMGIEMKGYVNPELFKNRDHRMSFTN